MTRICVQNHSRVWHTHFLTFFIYIYLFIAFSSKLTLLVVLCFGAWTFHRSLSLQETLILGIYLVYFNWYKRVCWNVCFRKYTYRVSVFEIKQRIHFNKTCIIKQGVPLVSVWFSFNKTILSFQNYKRVKCVWLIFL